MNALTTIALPAGGVQAILDDCATELRIDGVDIVGGGRSHRFARPRFAVMWAAKEALDLSLPRIAQALGGIDHTSVLHGIRRAKSLRASEDWFRALTDMLAARASQRKEANLATAEMEGGPERSRCSRYAAQLIGPLRKRAGDLGYVVALGGASSIAIELIAVPWSEHAASAELMAELVRSAAQLLFGGVRLDTSEAIPVREPHGRLRWPIAVGPDAMLDLSVMPRGALS